MIVSPNPSVRSWQPEPTAPVKCVNTSIVSSRISYYRAIADTSNEPQASVAIPNKNILLICNGRASLNIMSRQRLNPTQCYDNFNVLRIVHKAKNQSIHRKQSDRPKFPVCRDQKNYIILNMCTNIRPKEQQQADRPDTFHIIVVDLVNRQMKILTVRLEIIISIHSV